MIEEAKEEKSVTGKQIDTTALQKELDILTNTMIKGVEGLITDLHEGLQNLIKRGQEKMNKMGFGPLSGPIIYEMTNALNEEIERFREKIKTETK